MDWQLIPFYREYIAVYRCAIVCLTSLLLRTFWSLLVFLIMIKVVIKVNVRFLSGYNYSKQLGKYLKSALLDHIRLYLTL